ncbi:MAG: SLBB domain-containing protein [Candidatus Eiseniibacteriota bacterium]
MTSGRRGAVAGAAAIAAIAALLRLATPPAAAQNVPSTPGPGIPTPTLPSPTSVLGQGPAGIVTAPVDPDTYVVGPGDVFQLTLSGRVTRSEFLTVGPEGALLVPGQGLVKVSGSTLADVRRRLLGSLAGEFRGVRIDLQLSRVRQMRIYVTGDVKEPGAMQVTATSRLSEALSAMTLQDGASRRNVELRRRDRKRIIGDLELFNRTGRYDLNPFLQDGDIVHVPTAVEFVEVHGAVARPGRIELGPSDSLRTLLDLAGGPLPSAQADRCLLVRWRTPAQAESLWFALADVYSDVSNPSLRDGDRAFIFFTSPFQPLERGSVYGEVENPGVYPLVTGQSRLSHLIRAAHGFLPRADLSTIRVFRAARSADTDPEFERLIRLSRGEMTDSEFEILRAKLAARREDYRVDWFRLEQSPELDILLRDGDIVRVDPLHASVRVEGEVRRPGIVEFAPRRSVDAYVKLAGGYSNRAASSKVRITRAVTGQSLRAKDVQEVAPGDLIWVPERADATIWQHLQTLITVAAQVATLVIAVRR